MVKYIIDKKDIKINDGVNLKLFQTTKYKDLNIFVSFMNCFNKKERDSLIVAKDIVGLVSKTYPTKKQMTKKKNLLYSANVDCSLNSIAYNDIAVFHYSFVDPDFVDDVSIEDYIDFIKETIFNNLFDDSNVNEEIRLLKSHILRKLDKPREYAKNQVIKILGQYEDRFNSSRIDIIDRLDEINVDDINNAYKRMIDESLIDITIIGNISDELIDAIKNLNFKARKYELVNYEAINIPDLHLIEESRDVNQSVLIVKYKLNGFYYFKGKDYYTLVIATSLFGSLPCSLLFQEIREKLSLCYTISATNDKYEGIISVNTLISKRNIEETIKQIDIQVNRLANGDYPLEQLETCKTLVINSLIQTMDDSYSIYSYYSKYLFNDEPFEEAIDGLSKVTKEDICQLFKDYKHLLTYVLKGENEKNSQ